MIFLICLLLTSYIRKSIILEKAEGSKELCYKYHLGVIADKPIAVQGGLMHKMYKVITDAKVYAIKWLNPSIMSRDGVMENMKVVERVKRLEGKWKI